MRYEPPLGNGIPHALVDDDVVDGYFLPKGLSDFLGGAWLNELTEAIYIRNHDFFQYLGHDA